MEQQLQDNDIRIRDLGAIFNREPQAGEERIIDSPLFRRRVLHGEPDATILLDEFPGERDAPACLFLRIAPTEAQRVRFMAHGRLRLVSCAAGGWLLEASDNSGASYWIPQPPRLRTLDANQRILTERTAAVSGLHTSAEGLGVDLRLPEGELLDWVIWQLPAGNEVLLEELKHSDALERQPSFTWSSQAACSSLADLYRYLVHGHVYQNAVAWPRKWKFCCELDAYELYLRLRGLEAATGKTIYGYLKRQIVYSVISRQSEDGGWYHGEWTDLKECHYRFHCGGLLLLENALAEAPDALVQQALKKGADFVASYTDDTDLGLWFLHDSLEQAPEMMDEIPRMFARALPNQKGRGAWRPTTFLGKSPTNKLILNTHVDTTVTLHRYGQTSGDQTHASKVASATGAACSMLALRPAEPLYRAAYRLVGLTLLPVERARALPLPVRAFKRLTWKYLTPRLYKLKWRFPRIVMPGGFIDRHLSPMHFDAKYHAVNIMDLVRLWRLFPERQELGPVIDGAIEFVMGNGRGVLKWWSEDNPRKFAVVVFAEAMVQLCMLKPEPRYRQFLAEALLAVSDIGHGLPPSLWGGNSEILPPADQTPCPIPHDERLLVANLCQPGRKELLVVNPTGEEISLRWQRNSLPGLVWRGEKGAGTAGEEALAIPPRSWLLGTA